MNFLDFAGARRDLERTFKLSEIWGYLAVDDVVARYKRTILGPLWNAGYMLATAVSMGVVFGAIFGQSLQEVLPYILAGLVVWYVGPGAILESANLLTSHAPAIKTVGLPIFFYVMRTMARTVLFFLHNLLVFFVVVLFLRLPLQVRWETIPGVALVVLAATPFCLLIGLLCARFRDVQVLINNFSQILMFVTPIMWRPHVLSGPKMVIVRYNPLAYMVDLIRSPLMGASPQMNSWIVVLGMCVVGWLLCLIALAATRRRIPFWL